MKQAILTGPTPIACRIGNAFVPVIYHPERKAEYLRHERFPRKAKATGDEAIAFASRVIWHRRRRASEKRRRLEGLSHPQWHFLLDSGEAA
jgi:hypothetical protein